LLCEMFFGLILRKLYINILILIFIFLVIWLRGFLPRFRYDKLIYLIWKLLLPICLFFFIFSFSIKLFNL
jgi:NADH-ubiquinone oxidoreductase chain 1